MHLDPGPSWELVAVCGPCCWAGAGEWEGRSGQTRNEAQEREASQVHGEWGFGSRA